MNEFWKKDDCGDNSDERANCPAPTFRCLSNQIKCDNTTLDICINRTQLCDGITQCPDGSDEGAFCSRDDCLVQNAGCSHQCQQSPRGAVCFCPSGYSTRNTTNYKKCEDIDECQREETCSQKCANINGGYNCACDTGTLQTFQKIE